jgi:HPt (histidine-containing phosphotransfer) domain-containing protein
MPNEIVSEAMTPGTIVSHPGGPGDVKVLDRTALVALEGVREDGEPDLIVELIDLYLEHAPTWLEQIKLAVVKQDALLLRRSAHTLRGSSSSLGVCYVAELSRILEHLDFLNPVSGFRPWILLLEQAFANARDALMAERARRIAGEF